MSQYVSIILLTYNNLDNTKKCIDLLYRYTSDFHLIIWDNKSTDGTFDYLNQLFDSKDNIVIRFNEKNDGIIKGRNQAYQFYLEFYLEFELESDLIMFIDADQHVFEGWKESYLELMEDYDLLGAEGWQMRQDYFPSRKITSPSENFNYTGCGGMVIKKEVIDGIGLFDERFEKFYFEDPDFCWRAYDAGYKIGWNYHNKITHHHKGPLLSNERKQYFMLNWKKFQNKWRGREMPVFKMK
jgi:O-antigen biosynthesis protein